jgi:MFS family permease
MLPALFALGLFSIGTAVAKNAQTIFITRLIAGLFGSAPVSNVAAALGDIWHPRVRGTPVALYAVGMYFHPLLCTAHC